VIRQPVSSFLKQDSFEVESETHFTGADVFLLQLLEKRSEILAVSERIVGIETRERSHFSKASSTARVS
jgi:hypothetical protein